MGPILLVILIVILFSAWPAWRYSRGWGYQPSGLIGVLVVILLVMLILGYV